MNFEYDIRIISTPEAFKKLYDYGLEKYTPQMLGEGKNALAELDCFEKSEHFIAFGWNNVLYESDDIKFKIIKEGLEMLEKKGYMYSITKKLNITNEVEVHKNIPFSDFEFNIPNISVTEKFNDEKIKEILIELDSNYEKILDEMECEM